MGYYINASLGYYEGDKINELDLEVLQRPSVCHEFLNGEWLLNLSKSKAVMWQKIKAERDHRTESGGYKVNDKWFHSDQVSRTQQLGLVLMGNNLPANLKWKTMDGSFVTMTSTLAQQILAAAAINHQAIFANAEIHRAAMEISDNPMEYDYSAGWPTMYSDK